MEKIDDYLVVSKVVSTVSFWHEKFASELLEALLEHSLKYVLIVRLSFLEEKLQHMFGTREVSATMKIRMIQRYKG